MSTHNGEKREIGADEQEQGSSKKPKRSRRWALVVVVLSVAALVWSCVPQGTFSKTPVSKLAIGDAVIAVRLSGGQSWSGLSAPLHDNWIMLLDEQAQQKASLVGERTGGDILWTKNGISYGGPEENFLTTDAGTSVIKGKFWGRYEIQRYELSSGALAVVKEDGTGYRVDSVHPDGTTSSVENTGVRGNVGQCGSRILAITDTERSESISSAAFEAYAAQSGGSVPEALMVVVQLTDHDGDTPPVLAVAPMIDGLSSRQRMFDCEGDVITVPSAQKDDEREWFVLQRWDLSSGQRTIIPVVDEDGNAIELGEDLGVSGSKAIRVGTEYRFVSSGGDTFAVDTTSGRGRHLFSLERTYGPDGYLATVQVTETGVYALKDRRTDRVVTLSYRPWEGGEWRDIFTTRDLAYYLNEGYISSALDIQSFALRPGWDGGAQ